MNRKISKFYGIANDWIIEQSKYGILKLFMDKKIGYRKSLLISPFGKLKKRDLPDKKIILSFVCILGFKSHQITKKITNTNQQIQ